MEVEHFSIWSSVMPSTLTVNNSWQPLVLTTISALMFFVHVVNNVTVDFADDNFELFFVEQFVERCKVILNVFAKFHIDCCEGDCLGADNKIVIFARSFSRLKQVSLYLIKNKNKYEQGW